MKQIKYINFYIALVIAVSFIFLYTANIPSIQKFNNNFIDMYFNIRGEVPASQDIIIVDVDEPSLSKLGHWPWRRDKIAAIVDKLTKLGVGVIGFDMVFAEEDESSLKKVAASLGWDIKDARDYDREFAQSIANSPSILGYTLNMEQNFTNYYPNVNALFIEKNKPKGEFIPTAKGVTANIKVLQESAYSSGSFNMFPDADGVVRSVPMLFKLDGTIYPSLTLEMIRVALGAQIVTIEYDDLGINYLKIGDLHIPTDKNGRIFVDYAGAKKHYHYISALDIYEDKVTQKDIEGKIVLFGTSAPGLLDLRAIPFDQTIPGVEIHANVLDNILHQHFLQEPSNAVGVNILLIAGSTLMIGVLLSFSSPWMLLLLSLSFLGAFHLLLYNLMFEYGIVLNIIYPTLSMLVTIGALFFSNLFYQSSQKERILGKFAKKVSPAVAETLIKSGNVDFEADEKEVTVFFSDVRDFTSISEGFSSAHALIDYLNSYMSPMSEIIIKNEGTIDKYIGDAIMAYWNAPLQVADHADKALISALRQLEALAVLNQALKQDALPQIRIGIGIHTGAVVVGEMGSDNRSDYTIIGDTVNLGSRIEGLCKSYGVSIMISEDTKNRLQQRYKIREVDSVQVKGKKKAVKLYMVLGFGSFDQKEMIRETLYIRALEHYKAARYEEAKELFAILQESYHDRLFRLYHDRCKKFLKEGITLGNGVFKHVEK